MNRTRSKLGAFAGWATGTNRESELHQQVDSYVLVSSPGRKEVNSE